MCIIILEGCYLFQSLILLLTNKKSNTFGVDEKMKERINVTIDKNLLEKSKGIIPNLSQFFEECLAKRLGWGENAIFPVHSAHDELNNIGESMANLHIMTEKNNVNEKYEELQEQKKDIIWRKIYSEYERKDNIELSQLHEASELLNVSSDVLADVLYVVLNYVSQDEKFKSNKWKWSYNKYIEYMKCDNQ